MASTPGRVFLVGAGPGDPGLLTLRAAHALRTADVLLYDALASDATIAFAAPICEKIFVGKRGGNHAMPQSDIEALMIRKARERKRVVRLKGGDPFVFGRGGEEAQALYAAGIPFEIVPGISSALAAPAYAGIPVTHRDHNTAFTVATGHEDPTKLDSTRDWVKLADPHRTLVLLMAMGNLQEICARLITHGLDAQTPAAIIQNGTLPTQRCIVGTLASIVDDAARAGLAAPAILIVGSVVNLRPELRWFDAAPLFGKRVLITRPPHQAIGFADALCARGAEPIAAPTIAIGRPDDSQPAERAIDNLAKYAWVAFTSQNAVDAFFARLAAQGRDARHIGRVKVAAVGATTAGRLQERGIKPDLVPNEFTAEAVGGALIAASCEGDRVLVYCAQDALDTLPRALRDAHRVPTVVAAYKTLFARSDDFAAKVARADIVTFASASAVHGFAPALGGDASARGAVAGKSIACIGPVTARAACDAGLPVDVVAETHTADGLIDALEAHFTSHP